MPHRRSFRAVRTPFRLLMAVVLAASVLVLPAIAQANGGDGIRTQIADARDFLESLGADDKHIDKAIEKLDKALEDKLWDDDDHLANKKAFDELAKAVKELLKADPPFDGPAGDVAETLTDLARMLAQDLLDLAIALGGDPKDIAKAEKEMAKGDDDRDDGDLDKAIKRYKKAWDKSRKALEDIPDTDASTILGFGDVLFTDGGPVAGADITGSFDGGPTEPTTTDGLGSYEVEVQGLADGLFRVDVSTTVAGVPLSSTRYGYVPEGDTEIELDPIELPNPLTSELFDLGGGEFGDFDEIRIFGLPPEVAQVFGEAFDQQTEPNAFPGLLGDDEDDPFNSTVFAWLVALDAAGNEVTTFPSPVTVRVRIPSNQHGDIFDIAPGNGVIDVPMYSFDEVTGDWVVEDTGIITNFSGVPYAEASAQDIRDGAFFSVYLQYETDHFSWWNLDYKKSDFPGTGFDFGDAGDAGSGYPTVLVDDGVRHVDPNRLWLGQWADLEDDADVVDSDEFDDGLLDLDPLTVRVNNWDIAGDIYLNVLIDQNDDGDWNDAGEWVVQNAVTGTPTFKGQSFVTAASWDPATEGALRVTVTDVAIAAYDGTGEFLIGETEDYLEPPTGFLFVDVIGDGEVTSDVGGIDCPATVCDTEVAGGAAVTLTATPEPGRDFLGWGYPCHDRGTNPTCTLVVGPNDFVDVSATFSERVVRAFSLAPGSPTLAANGWSPADILLFDSDSPGVTRLFSTGDLGLDPGDNLDALTYPYNEDPPFVTPDTPVDTEFSVTEGSAGDSGTQIEAEAACAAGDLGGDVWGFAGFFGEFGAAAAAAFDPFLPFQWVDEDGSDCGTNSPFFANGLLPGDELDAWSAIDLADPGVPWFSLAPGSPTLGLLGASPADVLDSESGVVSVVVPEADLGLVPGDDIDALDRNQHFEGERLSLSLTSGSPSLPGSGFIPWNGTTVLVSFGFGGNFDPICEFCWDFSDSDLGLLTTDDLDALERGSFDFRGVG